MTTRHTYAEILDLATYDDGICGDCTEGRCHWGSQQAAAFARLANERCGCARHRVSVVARRQCGEYPPNDLFGFIARCRRTKGHKSTEHRDGWREWSWTTPTPDSDSTSPRS